MHKFLYIFFFSVLIIACKGPDARRPVQNSSGTFFKESAERNKKLYEKEKKQIAALIKNDTAQDYIASESGFWYAYHNKDTTLAPKPILGDKVTFTYDVKDLSGKTILTEAETGLQTYVVDQSNQELTSGLRDGIKLMREGEKVTFLFPSYKAYGYYGIENKLGTNVPVQSTVTLKSVEQTNDN